MSVMNGLYASGEGLDEVFHYNISGQSLVILGHSKEEKSGNFLKRQRAECYGVAYG